MKLFGILTLAALLLPTAASAVTPIPAAAAADSIPRQWTYAPQFDQTLPVEDSWWQLFGNKELSDLIELAERNNYNVRMALRRIDIAQNALKAARSPLYPTVDLSAGWTATQQSGRTTKHIMKTEAMNYFQLVASMQWEIDVFGRVKAQEKLQKASLEVSRADRDAVLVSVAASVAKAYFQLRVAQAELQVARTHIESQEKIEHITEVREETGLASGLDVSQAKQVMLQTRAMIPQLEQTIRSSINALAMLTGRYPDDLAYLLKGNTALPELSKVTPVGIPADLLRRRPDIVQTEKMLAEYAAQVGIAEKDFLPTLSLSASAGTAAHNPLRLFTGRSYTWEIAPQISWTAFDGMARKYRTNEAKLQLEAGVDNYNMVVLTAYQEVENAMAIYSSALEAIDIDTKLLEQANETMRLSLDLYKQGLTDFSNVADAQISTLTARNRQLSDQGEALAALVTLYQALGGGWGYDSSSTSK